MTSKGLAVREHKPSSGFAESLRIWMISHEQMHDQRAHAVVATLGKQAALLPWLRKLPHNKGADSSSICHSRASSMLHRSLA